MIEASSEQKNDQNHDHDHDPITFRKEKIIYIYQIEKLENKFISTKWRKNGVIFCIYLYI